MTTLRGELVFVPIFGPADYIEVPEAHGQLWGLQDEDDYLVIHALHADGTHDLGANATGYFTPFAPFNIFESEARHIVENPTDVPPIVSQRLAQLALAPEMLSVRED